MAPIMAATDTNFVIGHPEEKENYKEQSSVLASDDAVMDGERGEAAVALDRNRLAVQHVMRAQPCGPPKTFRERIDRAAESIEQRVRAGEVADDYDAAARFAHADHLGHHAPRVGHHGHYVKGQNPIEAVVGKL